MYQCICFESIPAHVLRAQSGIHVFFSGRVADGCTHASGHGDGKFGTSVCKCVSCRVVGAVRGWFAFAVSGVVFG